MSSPDLSPFNKQTQIEAKCHRSTRAAALFNGRMNHGWNRAKIHKPFINHMTKTSTGNVSS